MNRVDEVKAIVARQFDVKIDSLKEETRFLEDLGGDSLDAVELILAVEEKFEVEIPNYEADELKTIGDVIAWLDKKS